MKLSEAVSIRAKVEVEFEGTDNKLTIWHNPSVLTAEFEAKVNQEFEDPQAQGDALCGMLQYILLEWDLIDDEGVILGPDRTGEVVPTTLEYLRRVPYPILIAVSKACLAAHQPSDPNGAAPNRQGRSF